MSQRSAHLDLDFSPARRSAPLGLLLLAIGGLALVVAGVQFHGAHAERESYADALSTANGRLATLAGSGERGGPAVDPRAAKAAATVARELQVPWAEMLRALEAVPNKEVALLAVEPSAVRHLVRITAEAKSLDAMLDYIDALRGSAFPEAELNSHQFENQTPGTPVRFVVLARWSTL